MRTITLLAAGALALAAFAAPALPAQGGQRPGGGGGWGPGSSYGRLYDTATMDSVSGEVTEVRTFVPARGMSPGVHLMLQTSTGPIAVHVGPQWYLERRRITFAKGDRVTVRGSRVTFDGGPALIAAEVRRGGRTLKLRDAKGLPVWSPRAASQGAGSE